MAQYVAEYAACPPRLFLALAEAAKNERLRRVWLTNYLRVIHGEGRSV